MQINIHALEDRAAQNDGSIVARCPACAQAGHDNTGNHLIVYPDGKFGCVARPKDKEHNREILRLVGQEGGRRAYTIDIKPLVIPPSTVLLRIGTLNAQKPVTTPDILSVEESMPSINETANHTGVVDTNPNETFSDGAESEVCPPDTGFRACLATSTACLA
jgi:hypothetical protein